MAELNRSVLRKTADLALLFPPGSEPVMEWKPVSLMLLEVPKGSKESTVSLPVLYKPP
jgi:hypothetical protein